MARESIVLLPTLQRLLCELGENICLARLRRKISQEQLAERAGISRKTLYSLEKGEPSVSIGIYANVLFSLGLEKNLALVASDDQLGRKLQDAGLQTRKRSPRRRQANPPCEN